MSPEAILDEIKDEWESVTSLDVSFICAVIAIVTLNEWKFNPVDLALQLLDDSSQSKDMSSFRQTKNMLSKALKGSVDSMSDNTCSCMIGYS